MEALKLDTMTKFRDKQEVSAAWCRIRVGDLTGYTIIEIGLWCAVVWHMSHICEPPGHYYKGYMSFP